jgi:hypothetical protein
MANNLEQELNIDGILLEICSTCVCCPEQSINIWFLSDTVCQRSSSNFSMWGILLKLLVFHLNFLIYTTLRAKLSLISPRVENKAPPFLCLIWVAHVLFPILCQNMSKITCIFRMIAKFREPITCSYRYMLGACNCTCCTYNYDNINNTKTFSNR